VVMTYSSPLILRITRIRKLHLFPSLGEGRHLLYWAPHKQLTSIIGQPISSQVKVILRPTVSRPVFPAVRSPSGTVTNFSYLIPCSHLWTLVGLLLWAPSLTRGLVCNSQLLLGLSRAVFLGSEFHETHDRCYCFKFETAAIWRTSFPPLLPPGAR
jgi:hypothetical protein